MIANVLEVDEKGWTVEIPKEIIEQLGWGTDDELELELTTDCYDWGETTSIVVSNNTKKNNQNE